MTQPNPKPVEEVVEVFRPLFDKTIPAEGLGHMLGVCRQEVRVIIEDLIRSEVLRARIEGEKAGRSNELVRLSEWGKSIDDQWNKHFEQRLAELTQQKGDV